LPEDQSKPVISEKTAKMADARRQKLMGGKKAPLVEILLRPSPNNDEWRQQEL